MYEADVLAQGGAWLLELWANLDFGEKQDFGKRTYVVILPKHILKM